MLHNTEATNYHILPIWKTQTHSVLLTYWRAKCWGSASLRTCNWKRNVNKLVSDFLIYRNPTLNRNRNLWLYVTNKAYLTDKTFPQPTRWRQKPAGIWNEIKSQSPYRQNCARRHLSYVLKCPIIISATTQSKLSDFNNFRRTESWGSFTSEDIKKTSCHLKVIAYFGLIKRFILFTGNISM